MVAVENVEGLVNLLYGITYRDLARYSPAYFGYRYLRIVDPLTGETVPYRAPRHQLEWFRFIKPGLNLIMAPRGHGKSTVFTYVYPLWKLYTVPNVRILFITASHSMVKGYIDRLKTEIEKNPRLRADFGDIRGEPWQSDTFNVVRTVYYKERSVTGKGVGAAITGWHGDLIIIDDPIDEESANSEKERERVLNWFQSTILPMALRNPACELILIGTSKHWEDLYQWVLKQSGWKKTEK